MTFYGSIEPLRDREGYVLLILAENDRYPSRIFFTGEDALMDARSAQAVIQAMIRSIGGQYQAVF